MVFLGQNLILDYQKMMTFFLIFGFFDMVLCLLFVGGAAPLPGPLASAVHALLACHGLLLALARAGVCSSALTARWQRSTMAFTAIRMNILQSLDVLRHLTAERSLDDIVLVDHLRDRRELLVAERVRSAIRVNAGLRENGSGDLGTDAMDVLE